MTREYEALLDQGIAWYQNGSYTEAEKAFFTCAEAQNNSLAYSYLGDMYLYGIGHGVNKAVARSFYEQAIKAPQPVPVAFYQLAMLTNTSTREGRQEYIDLLEQAGQRNFAPAHTALARELMAGNLVPKMPEEAIRLYKMAISQGDACAMYELADYYLRRDPSRSHLEEAFDYMMAAAEAGHPEALLYIGQLYANSYNDEVAIECWQRAAEAGNADAYYRLGYLAELGRAGAVNMADCYARSAIKGFDLAEEKCRELGIAVTIIHPDGSKKVVDFVHRFP